MNGVTSVTTDEAKTNEFAGYTNIKVSKMKNVEKRRNIRIVFYGLVRKIYLCLISLLPTLHFRCVKRK